MDKDQKTCQICYKPSELFNYGAPCCNACKMFFRRVKTLQTPLRECENNEICYKNANEIVHYDCRLCRFQQCIRAGMIENQEKIRFFDVVPLLHQLEIEKRIILENYESSLDNISFEKVTDAETIQFKPKSLDTRYNYYDYEFMTQISTIDYLKKLDFVKMMTSSDSKAFLKSAYLNCAILSTAMHCYSRKMGFITFPEGTDVFPTDIDIIPKHFPQLELGIKCRMIGKLSELRITQEEFLLLNMIFICNPGISYLIGFQMFRTCLKPVVYY
ncbi:hypothetical protein GCK72_001797 [Caenorhabditis remanei]|uniref:Nuclear receptor domain-containing protein n=1 Tax=Caenorhabditis remanei TaxID=31234 RepID=A0A6A5HP25_CAERE|nr:hypothetical protein GCK72_001797 [Caenorhabditis remanei]KAF1769980.1 hypothetical protein GCK72_001797 [Caenorhabditis remanei]